jgi:hypothetical protein
MPVLMVGLAVAGCESNVDGLGVAGASASAEAGKKGEFNQTRYVRCLREHGANVTESGGGVGLAADSPDQDAKNEVAKKACLEFAPDGGAPTVPDAEQLEQLHRQVVCLREHGLQVQDPGPPGYDIKITAGPGELGKVEAAERACIQIGPGSSQ